MGKHRGLPGNYPIFHPVPPGKSEQQCAEVPLNLHRIININPHFPHHPGDSPLLSPGLRRQAQPAPGTEVQVHPGMVVGWGISRVVQEVYTHHGMPGYHTQGCTIPTMVYPGTQRGTIPTMVYTGTHREVYLAQHASRYTGRYT